MIPAYLCDQEESEIIFYAEWGYGRDKFCVSVGHYTHCSCSLSLSYFDLFVNWKQFMGMETLSCLVEIYDFFPNYGKPILTPICETQQVLHNQDLLPPTS